MIVKHLAVLCFIVVLAEHCRAPSDRHLSSIEKEQNVGGVVFCANANTTNKCSTCNDFEEMEGGVLVKKSTKCIDSNSESDCSNSYDGPDCIRCSLSNKHCAGTRKIYLGYGCDPENFNQNGNCNLIITTKADVETDPYGNCWSSECPSSGGSSGSGS